MNIFELMSQTLKELASESQCSKAEAAALYSDISDWSFPQVVFESAYLSLNASILLPFLGLNSIQEEKLRNQLLKTAWARNFEGYWTLVAQLVQIEPYKPAKILEQAITALGTNAFFGNHIRSMKRIYKNMIVRNPYAPSTAPVRKPQRKRGYNDKGHLPLKHVTPKGKPKIERQKPQEIQEDPRFYSNSLIGDRSNIAAELLEKNTSARRKKTRRRRKTYCKVRNSKRYFSGDKITKEEWHQILNYEGKN